MTARLPFVRSLAVAVGYGLSEFMLHVSHTWPLLGHVA